MNMLAIDTSTQTMGVALLKDNVITAEKTIVSRNDHSNRLMPAIDELMRESGLSPSALNRIVVTNGPGSYTGTRIAVTTAKTLSWALGIPIKTVSTLKLIAYNGSYFKGFICPFIDARRGMVYTGLYRWEQGTLVKVKNERNIDFATWLRQLEQLNEPVLFLSEAILSFQEQIHASNIQSVIPPSSTQHICPVHLFSLSYEEVDVPVHDIVPNYLRLTEAEAKWQEQQTDKTKGDSANG